MKGKRRKKGKKGRTQGPGAGKMSQRKQVHPSRRKNAGYGNNATRNDVVRSNEETRRAVQGINEALLTIVASARYGVLSAVALIAAGMVAGYLMWGMS